MQNRNCKVNGLALLFEAPHNFMFLLNKREKACPQFGIPLKLCVIIWYARGK
jgi:hypothetical protein